MKKLIFTLAIALFATLSANAELYLVGAGGDWSTGDRNRMSESNGVYTWTGDFTTDNDFKFIEKMWAPGWASIPESGNIVYVDNGQSYPLAYREKDEGADNKFKMSVAGNYTVTVDLRVKGSETMVCTLNQNVVSLPNLWITGGGVASLSNGTNGWNNNPGDNYKLKKAGNTYTISTYLTDKNISYGANNSRFIFLPSSSWDPRFVQASDENVALTGVGPGTTYNIEEKGNNMGSAGFVVAQPGPYNITINLNDDAKTGTMTLEKTTLCVIGPAVSNPEINGGWDYGDISRYKFDILEDGNYTITHDFKAAEVRINVMGEWAPCFAGIEGTPEIPSEGGEFDLRWSPTNASIKFAEAGNYTLLIDFNTEGINPKLIVTRNEESPETPDMDLWLIGAATPGDWDLNSSKNQKMNRDGNTYTWIGPLTQFGDRGRFVFTAAEGEYQPRFVPESKENPQTIKVGEPCNIVKESSNEPSFYVDVPAVYKVTITLNDDMESGVLNLEYAPICLSGPAVSGKWESADLAKNELSFDGKGKYTWSGEVGLEAQDQYTGGFRINQSGEWNPSFWPAGEAQIPAEGGSYEAKWVNGDQNNRFQFTAAGKYTVMLDLTTEDGNTSPKVVVTPYEEKPLTELYIVGNALNGKPGNWDLNDDYVKPMTLTESPGEFTWEGSLYKDGELKFLYSNESWDGLKADSDSNVTFESGQTYGLTEANDFKFVVPKDDTYTVVAKTYGDDKNVTITGKGVDTSVATIGANSAIYVNGRQLTVEGTANVYDFAGRLIASFSNGTRTLPAGLYIVVCEGKATRIFVK